MTEAIDLDALRGWIGREETAEEPLTEALAARYAATLDLGPPPATGEDAPFGLHLCLTQPAVAPGLLGRDGHPARGGFLPPVPLPRRMWAGGEFRHHAPLRVGDVISRRSTIEDVALKQGRTGPLCFVTVRHRISSDGRLAQEERQDIVYREDSPSGAKAAPPPAPEGPHRRSVAATPTLLFRYSALTFNGHRIHYDEPYAREVENYPGLVIHGPLQASLMRLWAEELMGAPPATFAFRGLSPICAPQEMQIFAEEEESALRLWTAAPGGPTAMEARASW